MVRPGSGAGHGSLRVLVGRTDRLRRPFWRPLCARWEHLRYEVTEEATASGDGGRWCHALLGIFHSQMDTIGNVVVPEDRIRAALESATSYESCVRA